MHYPSEYAYHQDSVNRDESVSANCRKYSLGGVGSGVHSEHHVHCDGTQLKLADSNLGQEQYSSSDYYIWSAEKGEQLLFIFPTRVSLTTITLHYYSDSHRGLPRLRFYAVPDDFDVWNAPTTSYRSINVVEVPPNEQSTGHKSVHINVNFNTRKILMYKFYSTFQLALSEVEFFDCNSILCRYTCKERNNLIRCRVYSRICFRGGKLTFSAKILGRANTNPREVASH